MRSPEVAHCAWPSKVNLEQVTYEWIIRGEMSLREGQRGYLSLPLCAQMEKLPFPGGTLASTADANDTTHCTPRPAGLCAVMMDSSLRVQDTHIKGARCLCLTDTGFCPMMYRCNLDMLGTNAPGCWEQRSEWPPPTSQLDGPKTHSAWYC